MKFNFVDDVWTETSGQRVTCELSETGGYVRLTLHAMENGQIAQFTLANYRMRRLWEGLEVVMAAQATNDMVKP